MARRLVKGRPGGASLPNSQPWDNHDVFLITLNWPGIDKPIAALLKDPVGSQLHTWVTRGSIWRNACR
jgi:hypothetical protein